MGAGNGKQRRGKVKSITDAPRSDLGTGAKPGEGVGAVIRPIAARWLELGWWDGRGVERCGGNDLPMTSRHRAESFLGPGGLKVRQPIH